MRTGSRNIVQIFVFADCDLLTINPKLQQAADGEIAAILRFPLNRNAISPQKLAQGVRALGLACGSWMP